MKKIFLLLLFPFLAIGQMPINRFYYTSKVSSNKLQSIEHVKSAQDNSLQKNYDSTSKKLETYRKSGENDAPTLKTLTESKKKAYNDLVQNTLDIFFIKNKKEDSTIDEIKLNEQISKWKKTVKLEDIEKNVEPLPAYQEAELINALKNRIDTLKEKRISSAVERMKLNLSQKDTLNFTTYLDDLDSLKKVYNGINRVYGNPKFSNRFFPARTRVASIMVIQQYSTKVVQFANAISLYGWSSRGSINPELMSFYGGPIRISLNTLVSSDTTKSGKDSSSKTANAKLRTLTGNGGNLVLSFNFPIFHFLTKHKGFSALAMASPKVAMESPILGTPFKINGLFGNFNLGMDVNMNVNIPIFGGSSLFLYTRPAYIMGTKPYLDALAVENNFWLVQSTIGIDVPVFGRIGFSLPTIANVHTLKTNTFMVSLLLSPQISSK